MTVCVPHILIAILWSSSVVRIGIDSRMTQGDRKRCYSWNCIFKTCASLDALMPCVVKLCVADISTMFEPSTTPSTTGAFAGLVDDTLETLATTAAAAWNGWTFCSEFSCGNLWKLAFEITSETTWTDSLQTHFCWKMVKILCMTISIKARFYVPIFLRLHNTKFCLSTTNFCKRECPRAMCDQTAYWRYLRTFWTKHHREHSSYICRPCW